MTAAAMDLVLEHLRDSDRASPADETAHKLGLSATDFHGAIEQLRAAGFGVGYVDRPGRRGFILLHEPHAPVAADVARQLTTRTLGRPLVFREETASTNLLAKELAERGSPHGTTVLARRQTAGRGRRGREWVSLDGEHLYLSLILRPSLPPERAFELTLTTAVALAETLEEFGFDPRIKWPNDLELDGRKVAGILAELAAGEVGLEHVVVGVGVNVDAPAEAFPEELRARATSLRAASGHALSIATLAAAFLARLEEWLVLHESLGFETVLDSWRARSSTLGSQVSVLLGDQVIAGVADEVDATGALLVRDPAGKVTRVVAGELTTLRRA